MSSRVSNSYVRLLYKYLEQRGLDATTIVGRPAPADDPTGRSFSRVSELVEWLERADRAIGEPAMGIAVGALIEPAHLGLVGYLLLSCKTLVQAVARDKEFARLYWDQNQGRFRPELRGLRVYWKPDAHTGNRLLQEQGMAAIVAFARNACQAPDDGPLEVHFSFPRPADLSPYEAYFKCPVFFGAEHYSMLIPYRVLLSPIRAHDESLLRLLEMQARDRIRRSAPHHDFISSLQETMAEQLSRGDTTLQSCADRMSCSPRTLQRRLDERHTSFQEVLDQTRQNLSKSYLSDPALRIAELSLLVGYADQAAFTRAFKRWTGMSPSHWRRHAQRVHDHSFL